MELRLMMMKKEKYSVNNFFSNLNQKYLSTVLPKQKGQKISNNFSHFSGKIQYIFIHVFTGRIQNS